MNYEYVYMMEDVLEGVLGAFSFSSTFSLVAYVFSALAVYTIAQRRGIQKAWMAWVPVLNLWILGSISDQYRYVVKGQIRNKRKVLLGLSIANLLIGIALTVYMVILAAQAMQMAFWGPFSETLGMKLMGKAFSVVLMASPMLVISLVALVFRAIALYDLYTSCEPDNKVLYLVLSLIPAISQITQPLFLFLCRNKDEGMPPRRQDPAEEVYEEPEDYHYTQL